MWWMSEWQGYGLDQVAGHMQWKQTISVPQDIHVIGATRWPAQRTAYSYNTNHAGYLAWAFQELRSDEGCRQWAQHSIQ